MPVVRLGTLVIAYKTINEKESFVAVDSLCANMDTNRVGIGTAGELERATSILEGTDIVQ